MLHLICGKIAAGQIHVFQTSDAEFDHITSFFVPPSAAEGFNVKRYAAG